ncbi:hypothetical protein O1611_g4227 [Lasiodiplodia mahajangana]|uniref:Uncharacterized protein n=1 Tax=Lasiodiplodia mahajangana TaxID=1108764 RepID=A0ACC2JPI6_9PEZI|nr:hypothetical protein O1611_g4227 [Lasiodiplodia mahajangana]
MATIPQAEPLTHSCGCQSTNHDLPKLVTFFREYGNTEAAYRDQPTLRLLQIPEDLGLRSPCAQCQLKTESGVETAICAIHCGPDALVEHDIMRDMFMSLIELRLQQETSVLLYTSDKCEGFHHEFGPVSITLDPPAPESASWKWEYIWHEWAKAFELRRDRVNIPELLNDLAKLPTLHRQKWWVALIRRLGREAIGTYGVYVSQGSVHRPSRLEWSALCREVTLIQCLDDLYGVYVEVDSRVHGFAHAHRTLRIEEMMLPMKDLSLSE